MNRSNKRIRILFLFTHLHKGGMQRAVSNISFALPDYIEQFVGFYGTENPGFQYNARLYHFNLPGSSTIGVIEKAINVLKRILETRKFVSKRKIDVVISFGESANLYNIISYHSGKKIISSRVDLKQSLNEFGAFRVIMIGLVKFFYPKADKIVAVSEDLRRQVERFVGHKDKIFSIPNLYHAKEILGLSSVGLPIKYEFLNDKRFILNVGSLCYQKGQDDLLDMFSNVSKRLDDVMLVILGRGEWKSRLQQQSKTLCINDKVIFIDFDVNPYRYMKRASLFVLTSRYEGFPNVLVEAMLCGTPVMAFDCPTGPSEILGEYSEHGILVKDRSIAEASDAATKVFINPGYKSTLSKIVNKRSQLYLSDAVCSKWVEVILDAIGSS